MKKRLHLIVKGQVHGVGFRNYTYKIAEELGISGFVRNLKDETVEIEAIGAVSVLEDFLHRIEQGSPSSVIAEVEDDWEDYDGECDGEFSIHPTR